MSGSVRATLAYIADNKRGRGGEIRTRESTWDAHASSRASSHTPGFPIPFPF